MKKGTLNFILSGVALFVESLLKLIPEDKNEFNELPAQYRLNFVDIDYQQLGFSKEGESVTRDFIESYLPEGSPRI